MKLSTIVLSALLIAGTAAFAQTGTKTKPVKLDSSKVVKKDGKESKTKTKSQPGSTKKSKSAAAEPKPQKVDLGY